MATLGEPRSREKGAASAEYSEKRGEIVAAMREGRYGE